MPHRWITSDTETTLHLWPHQSLTPRGFRWFFGITAGLIALPILAVLGSLVAWVLMIFFGLMLTATWWAVMRNRADRHMHEELTLAPGRVRLAHVPARGAAVKEWEANPYWVRLNLRDDGPVKNYLTLSGAGREVELGAFLSEEERQTLYGELGQRLRQAAQA